MKRHNLFLGWKKLAVIACLATIVFLLPMTISFAASSRSSYCRAYAHDYSLPYSAGGAMGGVVRGAVGAPSLTVSRVAPEERAGAQAVAQLSVACHALFKGLRFTSTPMHAGWVVDGRKADVRPLAPGSSKFSTAGRGRESIRFGIGGRLSRGVEKSCRWQSECRDESAIRAGAGRLSEPEQADSRRFEIDVG